MRYSHKQVRLKGIQLAKSVQCSLPHRQLRNNEIIITDWIARKIGVI